MSLLTSADMDGNAEFNKVISRKYLNAYPS